MLKSLSHKLQSILSWDYQNEKKVNPVSHFVPPNQIDTISSAKEEGKLLSIGKVLPTTANTYYQDSQSPYNTDSLDSKLSAINVPPRQKHIPTDPVATLDPLSTQKPIVSDPATVSPIEIDFDTAQKIVKENYKQFATNAGQETQDFISQTKVQNDGSKSSLDQRLEQLSQRIDEELKKDTINFDALQAMVLKIVMLHMRRTAKVEHEYTSEQGLLIKLKAIEVKNAYTSWSGLAVAVTSATLSIGGGMAGLSPFAGSVISPDTVKTLVGASQPISNASMGVNSVGGIYSAKDNSTKGYHEFHLRLMQSKEENAKERKRSNGEVIKTTKNLLEETSRNQHQLFSSFSSNSG
jgi:hypothetical protein